MSRQLTAEEHATLAAARSRLGSAFDRIAFDNTWVEGLPLGLLLMAGPRERDEDPEGGSDGH